MLAANDEIYYEGQHVPIMKFKLYSTQSTAAKTVLYGFRKNRTEHNKSVT